MPKRKEEKFNKDSSKILKKKTTQWQRILSDYTQRVVGRFVTYTKVSQTTYITILASVIGILGGFGAIIFRALISFFQGLAIGGGDSILSNLYGLPWYTKLLIPTVGGLIVGPLVYFFAREAKGHGVPEVIEAVALRNGRIRPRVVAIKSLASAISIGTGGSVGREGPIVQIGSALASSISQLLKVKPEQIRLLVGCGAAAGIAATFNAPIAGTIFALEVILGDFGIPTFGPTILSSVLATVVSRAFLGDYPAFIVTEYSLISVWEIPLYVVLGIFAGIVALGFMKLLYKSEDTFDSLKMPEYLKAGIGGFLIGCLVNVAPHVYGVGYETIDMALRGELVWYILLMLLGFKLLATSITLGSGGSGGIFAPSIFLGATLGGAYGSVIHNFLPTVTAHSGAYSLVGMGAVVAATTHAPIAAILILFEMTGSYKIILPLMITISIASVLARRRFPESIYTMKLARRGVSVRHGHEELLMRSFTAKDIMKFHPPQLKSNESFTEIVRQFMDSKENIFYTTDKDGHLIGSISLHDLKSVMHEEGLKDLIVAADLVNPQFIHVQRDEDLAECMAKFEHTGNEHLPVIEDTKSRKLIGMISRQDIINLYNKEILRKEFLGIKFERQLEKGRARDVVEIPSEYKIDYLVLPPCFVGKTLKEANLRAEYNVTVLSVRRKNKYSEEKAHVPGPATLLQKDDVLIIVATENDIDRLKAYCASSELDRIY